MIGLINVKIWKGQKLTIVVQCIRTCIKRRACIKQTLARVRRVSAKYRFDCSLKNETQSESQFIDVCLRCVCL